MKDLKPRTEKEIELIKNQLRLVLASPYFKSAQQMQKFLNYNVHKTLANKEKQITQHKIAVEGLGLPVNFNSDDNPLIRIIAGRVRKRLDNYYAKEGLNDPLLISVNKGSYIPQFTKRELSPVSEIIERNEVSCGPKFALVCFSDKTQNKISNRLLFQITDTLAKECSLFLFSRLVVSIPHADKTKSNHVEQEMKDKHDADFTLALHMHQLLDEQYELLYRLFSTASEEVLCSESFMIDGKKPIKKQQKVLKRILSTITDLQHGTLHVNWARQLLKAPANIPKKYQVLAYYQHQSEHFTRDSFRKAVGVCDDALNLNTKDLIANVVFADYCRQEYIYGYGVIDSPLDKGLICAEKATILKPNSHEARYVLGQILFNMGEKQRAVMEFENARRISKYHPVITFGIGYHFCIMNQWDKGIPLIEEVINTDNIHPDWYFMLPFLNEYRQKKYNKALEYAKRIISPGIFWGSLARATCYAQLEETTKATKELNKLLKLFPSFATRGKPLLKRYLGYKALVDDIWEGLLKAGLTKKTLIIKNK